MYRLRAGRVIAVGSRIANANFRGAVSQDTVPANFPTPTPTTRSSYSFFTKVASPFGGWREKVG